MSQSAISNRLASSLNNNGLKKGKQLDLQDKLSIQAKQNALPKVTFGPAKQEIAADLEKLRTKYTVLKPASKQLVSSSYNLTPKKETPLKEKPKTPTKDGIPDPKRTVFPAEKVVNRWREGSRGMSGLVNMGNTCFLNASLQCLFHTPALANILMTNKIHRHENKFDAMAALQQIMRQSQSHGPNGAVRPAEIVYNMKKIGGHFTHGRQECAHEFTRLFMDAMLRSSSNQFKKLDKYEEATTIPHRVFGGWLRSRVTCMNCRHNSDTYESFLDLPMEIKNCETLFHCFQKFTRKERLDESNKYKCEKCRQLTTAEKQFTVHRAPNVLAICLKRFSMMGTKLSYDIKYREKLSINRYCSNPNMKHDYELYAILVHSGMSVNSGHYYSYCKTARGGWCKFDDCTVTQVPGEIVMKKQPYLLYYRRISASNVPIAANSASPRGMTSSPRPILAESRLGSSLIGPKRPGPSPPPNGEAKRPNKQFNTSTNTTPTKSPVGQGLAKWKPTFQNGKSQSTFFNRPNVTKTVSPSPTPPPRSPIQVKQQQQQANKQHQRSMSMTATLQHVKTVQSRTPEKTRKMEILNGKNDALARISTYSSDEEPDLVELKKKKDLEKKAKKRKFQVEGGFWGMGKAPSWVGKENETDKKDRELSKVGKKSVISDEQLEIDHGKTKKAKTEEKKGQTFGRKSNGNPFQREQMHQYRKSY